ncbi:glycosyl transferase family 90 [Pseudalkalibacillus sp. R45]|uniref:glycosyl transferase family 90 n=1 Tax=Pseudalkalibacillus sp. R45 TaxID=3457433 RepID=UPI003FCD0BD2
MGLPLELIEVTGTYPKLDIVDHGGWGNRHESFFSLLDEMFQRYEKTFMQKKLNFVYYSGDRAATALKFLHLGPVFANCTTEKFKNKIIPIPDFHYSHGKEVGVDDWETIIKQCKEKADHPYEHKQCFWIGDVNNHRIRKKLQKLAQRKPDHLKALGMEWEYNKKNSKYQVQDGLVAASNYIPIPDHAKYKYLIDLQGIGYSSRLKLLMHLKRPVFVVERQNQEFFFPYMEPYKHYIPVKRNLSDLVSHIEWLDDDEKAYKMIAEETTTFAEKYLSKKFALEHLYRMMVKHAIV